jgi:uncharacterized protein (DUF1684 family)
LKRFAALCLSVAVLGACEAKPLPTADVATWRADKDRYMRSSESPVPVEKRSTFPPLLYFPIDPAYRVPASLAVAQGNDVLRIPTSTGQRRDMRRIGTLRFMLQGKELTLTAFVDASENDMRRLFVPFGDFTNGPETYPGGRYLDLERTASGAYDLDFNRAYHPFCVYNPKYDCPYPPKENRLSIPVRAGEKLQK